MKLNVGFSLICCLLVFTPLARGSVFFWTKTLILIAAVSGLFIVLVSCFYSEKSFPEKIPLFVPLAAIMGFVLLTGFLSDYPGIVMESVVLFLAYLAIYFCALATIRTRRQERIVVMLITGTAVFISVIAYLKDLNIVLPFWTYADLKMMDYLTGTYGNHNHFAGYLEMAIPVTLGLFLAGRRSGREIFFFAVLVLFLLFTQVLTFSRGGWLSTLSALFFMVAILMKTRFFDKIHLRLIFLTIIFLLLFTLFNSPVLERVFTLAHNNIADTFFFRLSVWDRCVEMIKDNLLAGTGPGTFFRSFVFYNPPSFGVLPVYAHNDYLQFVAETGVFFLFFCLWLVHDFFKIGFAKLQTQSHQTRGITLGAMASVFAVLVHSLFDFNLHIPSNALTFTILAAVATSPVKQRGRSHA